MYALVEIAAQPTETLPAGAVMEIWCAHDDIPAALDGSGACFRQVTAMFKQDLESFSLDAGSMLVHCSTDPDDSIAYIVEWTMPGKPTRRFRIQDLPY